MASTADGSRYGWRYGWRDGSRYGWRDGWWYGSRGWGGWRVYGWRRFDGSALADHIRSVVEETIDAAREGIDAATSAGCDDWWDEPAEWTDDTSGYDPRRWRDIPR
jgi:hypothetical protein